MHSRTLGLLAGLFAGVGWAVAQAPAPMTTSAGPTAVTGGAAYPAFSSPGTPVANGSPVVPSGALIEGGGGPILYGAADYLLWQVRSAPLPVAVNTAPVGLIAVNVSDLFSFNQSGTPNFQGAAVNGYVPVSIINQATFGARSTNVGGQNGARFTLGFWTDPDMSFGMEASFLFLERGSDRFSAISSQSGNQFLLDTGFTRDLYVITPEGTELLRTFDVFVAREAASSLVGRFATQLYGAELNGRCIGFRVGGCDFGGLAGFRYLNYNDELLVLNNVRLFAPPGIPQTESDRTGSLSRDLTVQTYDRIRVKNNFFGGTLGVDMDARLGDFFINTRFKASVGLVHQVADVESQTSIINNDPGRSPPSSAAGGGLLASPDDLGRHNRDRFGFIPEVNVKVGYDLADWFRFYVGYDALVLTNFARSTNSTTVSTLNTTINVGETPPINVNVNQPTFRFQDRDVWVQGLTFGFEARY